MGARNMAAVEARYRLVREVGRGSYGVVFEALARHTGLRMAVKRMACAAPESAELALHEFRALCRVQGQHGNVVRLEEAVVERRWSDRSPGPGDFQRLEAAANEQSLHQLSLVEGCMKGKSCCLHGGTCAAWFVMEFCDGGTLNDYVLGRAGPQAPLNRRFMAQLASAAAFLHRNHIVHRDLKPDNILVTCEPRGPQLKSNINED